MKIIIFLIAFVSFPIICLGDDTNPVSVGQTPLIEAFSYSELPENITGCSCSFRLDSTEHKLIFISDMGKKIWMKVDGNFTKLINKDVNLFGVGNDASPLGRKVTYYYQAGKADIFIETEKISECSAGDLECEGERYKASFNAIKGDKEMKVQALGGCGC